jgi:hypothetical protein
MKSTYPVLFKSYSLITVLFLTFCLLPAPSDAQRSNNFITANDIDAEILPRVAHKDAELAITTREGSVDLLLTSDAVVIQFTDTFLKKIEGEIRETDEMGSDESHFANVIRSMVSSGVKTLLDRALAIPIYEIEDVYYENGRLFIINRLGEELFKDLEVDDKQVMDDFSRRDARKFVAEAEKQMI